MQHFNLFDKADGGGLVTVRDACRTLEIQIGKYQARPRRTGGMQCPSSTVPSVSLMDTLYIPSALPNFRVGGIMYRLIWCEREAPSFDERRNSPHGSGTSGTKVCRQGTIVTSSYVKSGALRTTGASTGVVPTDILMNSYDYCGVGRE